jgi:hypothetical protein
MVRSKRVHIVGCCVAVLWLEGVAPAVAQKRVESAERVSTSPLAPMGVPETFFSDSELTLRFVCHAPSSVAWQATAVRRPFASGVVEPRNGTLEIRLRTPHVKEGVVLPIQVAAGDTLSKIHIFGRDPLADRRNWAEALQVVLFDPSGKTAKAFGTINLPYRQLTGLGGLAAVNKGIVVIGEGLSLADHPGLDDTLCRVARQGVPVVLLAPESGDFRITDPAPVRFELRDESAGQQIDPRTVGDLKRSGGYRVSGDRNGPVLRITDERLDYAWGDFRFNNKRGRLCCLTWNLLETWETSPAPRFFFVRLLEIVSSGKDLSGGKQGE